MNKFKEAMDKKRQTERVIENNSSDSLGSIVVSGQMSIEDFMHQTFGCDATDASELPSDKPSFEVMFEGVEK